MALRNAFENIMTDRTGRAILSALSFARDSTQQLRVVVMNAPQAIIYKANTSDASINRSPYGDNNAVFMVDERWQQLEASNQTFNMVRNGRWSFS